MPVLDDYQQFDGRHWETGSAHNFMAYRGFTLPHNDRPPSEALLMGISGGAVMGYFTFAYKGYDPQVNILTRNTFDPMETMLARLGVDQTVKNTASADKARRNLLDALETGSPAIVWADPYSLAYNHLPDDEGMWGMLPILVFGYDEERDVVCIADRARVPLEATPEKLQEARSRVKKMKHRLLTLGPPNGDKLATAVSEGIRDCVRLYLEKPPKGAAHNFGFAAYNRWADLLTKPQMRGSWEKEFPTGGKMYAGLTSAFNFINIFGKEEPAERNLYAAFLDEAAVILDKAELTAVAEQFRGSTAAWEALSLALLPDDVPLLQEARELMLRRRDLFLNDGNGALAEIKEIDWRLGDLRKAADESFPLSQEQVVAMRQDIADAVMQVHDVEQDAIAALQEAMAST